MKSIALAIVVAAGAALLLSAVSSPSSKSATLLPAGVVTPPLPTTTRLPLPTRAHLRHGKAIAPAGAPARVRAVIAAANRIRHAPYAMGGGHAHFRSSGYDCSGSVSFALHGGGLLRKPLSYSGAFESFGKAGPGRWITVYGMGSHAYAVIAGLRWDTAGTGESGPRWHRGKRSDQPGPYVARHPAGF